MRLFILIAGLALAGCATPCANAITQATTRTLRCEDGSRLVVTFQPTPNGAHIEQVGYPPADLEPLRSASGYRYVEGGAELRGTLGADAFWTRPGAAMTECREVGPDEAASSQTQ